MVTLKILSTEPSVWVKLERYSYYVALSPRTSGLMPVRTTPKRIYAYKPIRKTISNKSGIRV